MNKCPSKQLLGVGCHQFFQPHACHLSSLLLQGSGRGAAAAKGPPVPFIPPRVAAVPFLEYNFYGFFFLICLFGVTRFDLVNSKEHRLRLRSLFCADVVPCGFGTDRKRLHTTTSVFYSPSLFCAVSARTRYLRSSLLPSEG